MAEAEKHRDYRRHREEEERKRDQVAETVAEVQKTWFVMAV